MADAFEEGMRLREKRRLKAAAEAFGRATAENPTNPLAWFWWAATLDNRALEAEAIPRYERALTLGLPPEETVKAWTWLASSYSKTARHEDALGAADEAAALGGYEPKAEFDKIVASVRRRSRRR